jgi:hypothetical protein
MDGEAPVRWTEAVKVLRYEYVPEENDWTCWLSILHAYRVSGTGPGNIPERLHVESCPVVWWVQVIPYARGITTVHASS